MLKNDNLFKRESLRVYNELKKADEDGRLEETVRANFLNPNMEKPVDMITIWRNREFIGKLSDEFIEKYPHILTYIIIVEVMKGKTFKADILLPRLGHTPEVFDISNMNITQLDIVRIMLELVLPQVSNREFARRAIFLSNILQEPIVGLALTACRPSVINGFRDLTLFCPGMEEEKASIEKIIEMLYGGSGKGVYDVAHAEWSYEQGDLFGALVEVAGTIPTLEYTNDMRCMFVAFVLQMRILLFNGQTKASVDMFNKLKNKLYETCSEELEASLIATECLHDCYLGHLDKVEKWLAEEAPNENSEIFMMDIYSYFVKMRCYLQTDQHMLAIILAKKILELLKPSERPHDKCECHIVVAMACYKSGDMKHAVEELSKALEIASPFHYVRLFADEGQVMVDLLKIYKPEAENDKSGKLFYDDKYIKEIKAIAIEVARVFPVYLQSEEVKEFELTKTERKVLERMADGMSNEEIGIELNKKEGTIKYHTANIYKKFNVANRQQAINFARSKGIL